MKPSDIPNLITVVRILLVVPVAWALLQQQYVIALVLFFVAGVSDGLDGFLAKQFNWTSRLGAILDPLADKALLVTCYAALAWVGLLPVWLLVLVVDDSITVRRVTERILQRNGMRVATAKDGLDAISVMQEQKPDVILLDIEMPRMDGYEFASHVRNDERMVDVVIGAVEFVGKAYFRAEIRCMDKVPDGPALVVGNHNAGILVQDLGTRAEVHYNSVSDTLPFEPSGQTVTDYLNLIAHNNVDIILKRPGRRF